MNVPNKTKGFTIIEVVLVLAIAGLIFLVVFLALPALQRSQRDTQRKSDLGKFMSQVTTYASNNQGAIPASGLTGGAGTTAWGTFISNYLTVGGTAFADPTDGTTYTVSVQTVASTPAPPLHTIWTYPGSTCANVSTNAPVTTSRSIAVAIYQEQGGFSCQNN